MNILQKIMWLLIVSMVSLNATDLNQTQVCQAFKDGSQTRANDSKIKFINNSYLFNNPDNRLNGFQVINNNAPLSCRDVNGTNDEACESSNALGISLPLSSVQVPEVFTFTEAVSNDSYIKIKNLKVKKNKNLIASSAIYLETLNVAKNSTLTIKAPKVVINNLSAFKKSNIKIIADTIDIKIIKLENRADLTIESFTEDTNVAMRIEKLKLKKASVLLNNGRYHIKRVELKNRSSLSVGDSVQIVNRRTVVLNHSRINASKNIAICDDEHNPNALFIYSNDLVRVEKHSKIVAMVYNDRRVEFTKHAGLKGAVSAKNRAIFKNHSKVCYSKCNLTSTNTDITPPVLTLNGSDNIILQVGNAYNELGATALDNVDGNLSVIISGSVDTSTVGVYKLTYSATDSANNEANITRTVNVVLAPDVTAPIITLNGDSNMSLTQGSEYVELNASAVDDRDGNVSVHITGSVNTNTVGTYTLTYTAKDSANNTASKTRTVNVVPVVIVDITPPVITLNGDENITLTQGSTYVELGANAVDNVDGNISVTVSGSVDTSTVGIYTITYSATDSSDNKATLSREISVVEVEAQFGVNVGKVEGNTAQYQAIAKFSVSLKSEPDANVTIPLSSSDENEGRIFSLDGDISELVFTPKNWHIAQTVYVRGENQNVVNGVQNYTIILGNTISDDANYDGLNPNDVEMKGLLLSGNIPLDTSNFIPTLPKILCISTIYNGIDDLNYTLSQSPNGMTINSENGCVMWEAPLSEEGNTHTVSINVNAGIKSIDISFEVSVSTLNKLQQETNENLVTITEKNSDLTGVKFRFLGDNPIVPIIRGISSQGMLTPPNGVEVLTDYFYADENNTDDVEVLIPVSYLNDIHDFPRLSLYYLGKHERDASPIWNMTSMGLKVEVLNGVEYGVLSIGSLKGVMFLGIRAKTIGTNVPIQQKQVQESFSKQSVNPANITINDISCRPTTFIHPILNLTSTSYERQLCTIDIDGIRDIEYIVLGFGNDNGPITHWAGDTTIEEMMVWIGQARKEFDNLGIGTIDKSITISLEERNGHGGEHTSYGVVYPYPSYRLEFAKTLHLNNHRLLTTKDMKLTTVHEYFHHAQDKTELNINGDNINTFFSPGNVNWLLEATAVWFEDYLYDNLNGYLRGTIGRSYLFLTEVGLDHENYSSRLNYEYATSFIFKLFSKQCNTFENNLKNIFYPSTDESMDRTRVNNLKLVLNESQCNFGNSLGEDNKASLDMAMLYYQYAVAQENNVNLLDSNENMEKEYRKQFKSRIIEKRDWKRFSFLYDKLNSYGISNFKLNYDDIKDTNKTKIKLSIKTDKPLTLVGIRLDERGKGIPSRIDDTGAFNAILGDFKFTTEAGVVKEYNFTDENVQGGLFIMLLNATGEEVNILDINITSRFERDDELDIVIDHERGLMWQDEPNTWLDSWYGAKRHCNALTLGDYDDWRVPTYDELIHILDLDGEDTYRYEIFEHLGPVGYWSLSTNGGVFPDTESAKVVNFGLATWIWINTSAQMNTRCTRTKE